MSRLNSVCSNLLDIVVYLANRKPLSYTIPVKCRLPINLLACSKKLSEVASQICAWKYFKIATELQDVLSENFRGVYPLGFMNNCQV